MSREKSDSETDSTDEGTIDRRRFLQGVGATTGLAALGLSAETVAAETGASKLEPGPKLLEGMPDNWGRWGDEDELGALNLLGSEEMFAGMAAATKRGKKNMERITLQTPITGNAIDALVDDDPSTTGSTDAGDPAFPGRLPARKDNTADWRKAASYSGLRFADDRFDTPLYLQGTSHVDALGHNFFADRDADDDGDIDKHDEQLYNGFPAETTATLKTYDEPVTGLDDGEAASIQETHQLSKADISNAADAGIMGRGVLLDVGRYKGDDENGWLPLNEPITLQDLKDTADAQGVEIRERDILLIRTGAIERARTEGVEWDAYAEPGLAYSDDLYHWLHDMDIPYMAGDNLPVEKVLHNVTEDDLHEGREDLAGTYTLPLHGACLRNLGLTLNEVLDLSELGAACAEDGIYEFLFTAAPLHVEGGTGGPVNPVVAKATDTGGGSNRGKGQGKN